MSCSNPFAHRPVQWEDTYSFKSPSAQLIDFLCAIMSAFTIASIYRGVMNDYSNFKSDYLSLPLFAFLVLLPIAARLHTVWLLREEGKSGYKSDILGFLGGYSYYYYVSYPYETKTQLRTRLYYNALQVFCYLASFMTLFYCVEKFEAISNDKMEHFLDRALIVMGAGMITAIFFAWNCFSLYC
ncbi:hypothetical protein BC833DRAFT_570976, partial [Globomyces pollinis-pini]